MDDLLDRAGRDLGPRQELANRFDDRLRRVVVPGQEPGAQAPRSVEQYGVGKGAADIDPYSCHRDPFVCIFFILYANYAPRRLR